MGKRTRLILPKWMVDLYNSRKIKIIPTAEARRKSENRKDRKSRVVIYDIATKQIREVKAMFFDEAETWAKKQKAKDPKKIGYKIYTMIDAREDDPDPFAKV